jgi:hypothetical protein
MTIRSAKWPVLMGESSGCSANLVEGHLLVSAKDGEEGMMLLTMIWSAFIRLGRIH